MTVTRLFQSGAEFGTQAELDTDATTFGAGAATVTTAAPKTGARHFSFSSGGNGKAISSSHVRGCLHFRHSGFSGAGANKLFYVTGATRVEVDINQADALLRILVGGSVVASVDWATAGLSTTNTYYAIGINIYGHASAGYVSVYVDGVLQLTYSGNTGGSYTGAYFGARTGSLGLSSPYGDDLYVDDITGESDIAPPILYFIANTANAAGNYSNWTPSAGSNYQNVDDALTGNHDSDTTYNKTTATATKDSYNLTDFTVPGGYTVVAYIPVAVARKTGTEDCKIKIGVRESGNEAAGSEQVLGTSYIYLFQRYTTRPGGGAWDQTSINAAEVLIESAGTFT